VAATKRWFDVAGSFAIAIQAIANDSSGEAERAAWPRRLRRGCPTEHSRFPTGQEGAVERGLLNVGDLAQTVVHRFKTIGRTGPDIDEREEWTPPPMASAQELTTQPGLHRPSLAVPSASRLLSHRHSGLNPASFNNSEPSFTSAAM
jgi:hypothetical protein